MGLLFRGILAILAAAAASPLLVRAAPGYDPWTWLLWGREVAGGTLFELEHTATVPPGMWEQFGPGAVGVGWDGALLGLAMHLAGGEMSAEEKQAWAYSEEARVFNTAASVAWGEASRAAGADAETVAATVAATTAFYVPPPGDAATQ